jgi:hypothetical protein
MTTENDMQELETRLRAGAPVCGLHHDNSTELFDIEAANETMYEAAQAITTTRAELAASAARVQALEGEVARLREALRWYADQMCEGLCQGKDPRACTSIGADNCAGCPAVVALHKTGERA